MGSRVRGAQEPDAIDRIVRFVTDGTPLTAPAPPVIRPWRRPVNALLPASDPSIMEILAPSMRPAALAGTTGHEIRQELRRMLLLNRSTFPLGTLACVVVLALLAWPHLPATRLLPWTIAGLGVVVMFTLALYPPMVRRLGPDGMPVLIGPAGHLCGLLFALAPWLDLSALRDTPWRWICLIMLFAMTSGTQSGTVSGTPHLRRVVLPVWLSTSAAYAVIGAWIVAVAALVYLTIIVRDHISTRRLVIAGVEARVAAHHAALTDPLTGLANRAGALAELDRLAATARPEDPLLVVLLYIDLDRFKQVNDTHGHLVGDALLVEASHRLLACCREGDLVARLGGDEFLMIIAARPGAVPDVSGLSDRIVLSMERGFHLGGRDLFVSASVGVASSRDGALNADEVIGRADKALYAAKRAGRRRAVHHGDLGTVPVVPAQARD